MNSERIPRSLLRVSERIQLVSLPCISEIPYSLLWGISISIVFASCGKKLRICIAADGTRESG